MINLQKTIINSGYRLEKTELLKDKEEVNISEVKFSLTSICHDGYECSGSSTNYDGTIIELLEECLGLEDYLSDKKLDDTYIPLDDFLKCADKINKEEFYPGSVNIDTLADMSVSSLNTKGYRYTVNDSTHDVSKDNIVNYLKSLYINKAGYLKDYGYDLFLGME